MSWVPSVQCLRLWALHTTSLVSKDSSCENGQKNDVVTVWNTSCRTLLAHIATVKSFMCSHTIACQLQWADLVQGVCQGVDGGREWLPLGVELSCLVGSGNAVREVRQRLQHVAQELGVTEGYCHAATCQGMPAAPHALISVKDKG